MSEPSLTEFESRISVAADLVYASGKTGYNWDAVDQILSKELNLDGMTRCKKANNSGRAANVLTESMDKDIQLYLVFINEPYTVEKFLRAAENRISRFPKVNTVAVLNRTSGSWRVRAIVERGGVGLADEIKDSFPALGDDDIHLVDANPDDEMGPAAVAGVPSAPVVAEDEFVSEMTARETRVAGISELPELFLDFAHKRGVVMDMSLATDVLAATLSSQLLMFAGPSGTGKSTVARLLRSFFAAVDRRFEVEAMRQWLTPDDLAGYYSVLGRQYATASGTMAIVGMHEASVAPLIHDGSIQGPPILLVEEMNLSAPEGYLAPVIHGLSGVSEPILRWELHTGGTEAIDEAAFVSLPQVALIGPFPRVFGTINVDVSAQAPARKVAARSSVVLVDRAPTTAAELEELAAATIDTDAGPTDAPGEKFLGNPLAALEAIPSEEISAIATKLQDFIGGIEGLLISRRDAKRCLAYMAYLRMLCGYEPGVEDATLQIAVENAFAHNVLPTVEVGSFAQVVEGLSGLDLVPAAASRGEVGGLLSPRVDRLLGLAGGGFGLGGTLDFWSALS